MHSLAQHKDKSRSLGDYLNYGSVIAPGVISGKDGSLLAARYFRGRNLAYGLDEAWDAASNAANRAFGKLTGGWAVWVEAARQPVSKFTDPAQNHFPPGGVGELIEAERRATFTQEGACLESTYAIFLYYLPPLKQQNTIINLMYDEDGTAIRPSAGTVALNTFQRTLREFDDQFSAAVHLRPMADRRWTDEQGRPQLRSELVNYLYFCVSGENIDIPLPPHGCYLDGILGKPADPGDMPKIGDMFVAVVGISGYPFPDASSPGILNALDLLPFPLRWSSRYIVLDQPEAEKQTQSIETKWKQKARGLRGYISPSAPEKPDAIKMSRDAADMIERTQSAVEGTGYYTVNIVLMDEDPIVLEDRVRVVRRAIRDCGFPTIFEGLNAWEAYLGTLPGHCVPNVRRAPLHTTNLADLIPLSAPWQGDEYNPCPMYPANSPPFIQAMTVGCTPINVNIHVDDRGHCLIFGPHGSGKSTLEALMAAQSERYKGALDWAFDKGRSLKPIYQATGRFYDFGIDTLSLCPLSVLETEVDIAVAEEWVALCFELQTGYRPKPNNTTAIHHAIQMQSHSSGRSLSHFVHQVQDIEVREAMSYYTLNGPLGYMLDAETDGLVDSLRCGFEISDLMAMGERALLPVMSYLFRRFQRMLKGQPAFLRISEAWTMFGHPVMRAKVFEWLKELRKLNTTVTMDTQSLSDANRSGILDILLESCPTRIYGANPAAMVRNADEDGQPGPYDLYRKFGVSDATINMIYHATPKKHYVYDSERGTALIDLCLGPKALKFVGATSKEDLTRIDALYRLHGDAWPQIWLKE